MERVIGRLKNAITFIQPYAPLIDSHMVTFFTSNLWERHVPLSLREEYNANNIDDVINIFSSAVFNNNVKFKELSRFIQSALEMDIAQAESLSFFQVKDVFGIENCDYKRPPLIEFMTKKKSHEVERLLELVAGLTHHTNVTHVVEVGDGKGYVSSLLALQHEIKVLGLESSGCIIHGAEKRKSKLHKFWKNRNVQSKVKNIESSYRQSHVEVNFDTDIRQCVQQKFPEDSPLYSLGLTGLHTCGDLSSICLHLFVSNKIRHLTKFLINVGCCYHLLNCSPSNNKPSCFPISSTIKKMDFHLTRNARMMSLQAPSKLFHLKKPPPESLMYRALLEQLLDDTFGPGVPSERDVGRIGVKCKNFVQYVRKASVILGCDIPLNDEEIKGYYKKFEPFERKLQFYFMLRVVLAPIVEGIILLDRLLFLKEKGLERSYLVKLFDPVISPRCYGIVAIKDN